MNLTQAELRSYLDIAISAARLAAKVLRVGSAEIREERESSGRDIKLRADIEAESVILKELARNSNFPIVAEESFSRGSSLLLSGCCWIVDPLDGTYNFSRDIPLFCISIALWGDGRPLVGVIYDIGSDALYGGGVGLGAFRNGLAVSVSEYKVAARALLLTGLPIAGDFSKDAMVNFAFQMRNFKKVRMLGSAAISLSLVASGSGDVYFENGIRIWDVAAGLALIVAAGGTYNILYTDESRTVCNVMAGQKNTLGSIDWDSFS